MSVDEKRGIVFIPFGTARYDFYGPDRHGQDLFGNSIVALDARTGKRLWHFQAVRHDLWDYDLPTAPKLLTVKHDGKNMDVVAQPTKQGFLFVFERGRRTARSAKRRTLPARVPMVCRPYMRPVAASMS
jgi:quinoprotein glucose dehydrogenase